MEEYYGLGVVGMKFLLMAYYQVVMLFPVGFPILEVVLLGWALMIVCLSSCILHAFFQQCLAWCHFVFVFLIVTFGAVLGADSSVKFNLSKYLFISLNTRFVSLV